MEMLNYPETVASIADDYLERVKAQLPLLPAGEREDFLAEVRSHIYEAYFESSCADEVARILAVLRNVGEPVDMVADRLPKSMVRSGAARNLPLYVLGGILVALFGLPLGFGGVAVLMGLLLALGGIVMAYYAVAGSLLFAGSLIGLVGLIRLALPGVYYQLVELGYINLGPPEFLAQVPASALGMLLIAIAILFAAGGIGMLRLGKKMLRGFRFLVGLAFDWMRSTAQKVRARFKPGRRDRRSAGHVQFVK